MISIARMSRGQLGLEFASVCARHGVDAVAALGRVHLIEREALRAGLLEYEAAARREDWTAAEDALLRLYAISERATQERGG